MMTSNQCLYKKVSNIEKTRWLRIKTEWEEDNFRLFVVASSQSWFSLVTRDCIKNLSDIHELEFGIYFKNLKECFYKPDEALSFDVKDDQFVIHRCSKHHKMKYFTTSLTQVNHQETIENIFDDLIFKCTDLMNKQKALEEEKLLAVNQRYQYEQKLEEFVNIKNQSDLKMTSSFLLLLNEKKKRICYLTNLLEECQSGRKPELVERGEIKLNRSQVVSFDEAQPSTSRVKETISDSESSCEVEYNTDDENNTTGFTEGGSPPKDNFDFLSDEDISMPSLPKRNKSDQWIADLPVIPSTSLTRSETTVPKTPKAKEDDTKHNSSNEETFNTQDLLDLM